MITCNNKTISTKERICSSFWSQARGLMFRKKQNLIMIFPEEKKISLHMFFVFYPIDVLLLNEKKEIIEIKKKLKPFTIWKGKEKAKYCIELSSPAHYNPSDKIRFKA